jgi:predicted RecB family nuclease
MNNARKKVLSKTRLMEGFQCEKRLWLKLYKPELEPAVGVATQMSFDEGNEVGELARKHFGKGELITNDYWDYAGATKATEDFIEAGTKTIFEAAFRYKDFFSRADIFTKLKNGWHVIEVKKSVEPKEYQILDSAIQTWIMKNCGHKVVKVSIMHLNRECVFPKLDNLYATTDITDEVDKLLPLVEATALKLSKIASSSAQPNTKIGLHCDDPFECPFKEHCWAEVPEKSVFDLPGMLIKKKWELYDSGKKKIMDLDANAFKNKTKLAIEVTQSQKPWFDWPEIDGALKQWKWPLYFFDFETINPAIPRFKKTSPYSQIPFQFSCHVWKSPESKLEHFEYLHTDGTDPRPPLVEAMLSGLGSKGSIVAYNMGFEIGVIKKLAEFDKANSKALLKLTERFVDPLKIFQSCSYHPEFLGSFSIKNVAPAVLGAKLSYENLEVGDGSEAQAAVNLLLREIAKPHERQQIVENLLTYCRQDTLAMVELVKWLMNKGKAA